MTFHSTSWLIIIPSFIVFTLPFGNVTRFKNLPEPYSQCSIASTCDNSRIWTRESKTFDSFRNRSLNNIECMFNFEWFRLNWFSILLNKWAGNVSRIAWHIKRSWINAIDDSSSVEVEITVLVKYNQLPITILSKF